MTDEQIDLVYNVLSLTKMKVFLREEGMLIPIHAIQKNFFDKDSAYGEPVAWLGGSSQGRCTALYCVEPNDIQIISNGECF